MQPTVGVDGIGEGQLIEDDDNHDIALIVGNGLPLFVKFVGHVEIVIPFRSVRQSGIDDQMMVGQLLLLRTMTETPYSAGNGLFAVALR